MYAAVRACWLFDETFHSKHYCSHKNITFPKEKARVSAHTDFPAYASTMHQSFPPLTSLVRVRSSTQCSCSIVSETPLVLWHPTRLFFSYPAKSRQHRQWRRNNSLWSYGPFPQCMSAHTQICRHWKSRRSYGFALQHFFPQASLILKARCVRKNPTRILHRIYLIDILQKGFDTSARYSTDRFYYFDWTPKGPIKLPVKRLFYTHVASRYYWKR